MIETLFRRNPVDQVKIFSVMFGMAFRAVFPIGEFGVQPAAAGNFSRNFRVAPLAVQYRGTFADHVTTRALRRATERLMSFGKRSRRNLALSEGTLTSVMNIANPNAIRVDFKMRMS